ncbi:MAG: glucosyltransferase domain-containing protein [Candidatus Sumerlaeota bacterium]|nr:glucosyltransferase domain-containing protein [Candidatus Sumerlaeota bacterium]
MILIYSKYKAIFIEFLRTEKLYLVLLALVAISAYGFTLTNFSISQDDVFMSYEYSGVTADFLAQGRWGSAIWNVLFGPYLVQPFFGDFIGVLLLCAAAITWTVLLREASNNKLRRNEFISFSLIFISYPLISEIFIWVGVSFGLGVGYLLTGLAMILSYEAIIKGATRWASLLSVLLLATAIAGYESYAAVFLCGIFCVLLLCFIFNENLEKSIKVYGSLLFRYCLLLFFAVALKTVISLSVLRIMHLSYAEHGGASNQILWLSKDGTLAELLAKLLAGIAYWFFYNSLFYQPVFSFVVACVLALLFAVLMRKKYKSTVPLILFAGLLFSNLALSLIQGEATPYRACQSFAVFVAFIGMLSCVLLREKSRMMLAMNMILFFVIYWQARDLSLWFYNDFHRFEMDRINFINVAQEIEKVCGKNSVKPVVFIGEPPRYDNLRGDIINPKLKFLPKYVLTSRNNGSALFGKSHHQEFYCFMDYYGFKFKRPSNLLVSKGLERINEQNIPFYPRDGCIREFPDSIVVNLGPTNTGDSSPGRSGRQIIESIKSFMHGRNSK